MSAGQLVFVLLVPFLVGLGCLIFAAFLYFKAGVGPVYTLWSIFVLPLLSIYGMQKLFGRD